MTEQNEELIEEKSTEDTDPKPNPLIEALATGDLETARRLKAEGYRISEDPMDFSAMLGGVFEERLPSELNGRQVNPDSLRRIVPLSEVVEKCGRLFDPGGTTSFGPRPEGWGQFASSHRVLSWRDDGFGLVGDQVCDVDLRLLAADSLEEFEDAIIAGPMTEDSCEDAWGIELPVVWEEKDVDAENLDVDSFRRLFLFRQSILKSLSWSYDFELNAHTKDPFQAFLHSEYPQKHVEVLCAGASLLASYGHPAGEDQLYEDLAGINKADSALLPVTEALQAVFLWLNSDDGTPTQTETLKSLEELGRKDGVVKAIHSILSTWPWSEVTPEEAVRHYQKYKAFMRSMDSPYLSWLLEDLCHRMLQSVTREALDAKMDDKERADILTSLVENGLYDMAVPLFVTALETGALPLLQAMMVKKVHVGGHFLSGHVYVPLADAVMRGNLPAVRLLCQHGADPLEKSQYGGWDSFECLRHLLEEGGCQATGQPQEGLQMGKTARKELLHLIESDEAKPKLSEMGRVLFSQLNKG